MDKIKQYFFLFSRLILSDTGSQCYSLVNIFMVLSCRLTGCSDAECTSEGPKKTWVIGVNEIFLKKKKKKNLLELMSSVKLMCLLINIRDKKKK